MIQKSVIDGYMLTVCFK